MLVSSDSKLNGKVQVEAQFVEEAVRLGMVRTDEKPLVKAELRPKQEQEEVNEERTKSS
jgi:hypothetical protein